MRWRDHEAKIIGILLIAVYAIFFFLGSFSFEAYATDGTGWVDPYTYTAYYRGIPEVSTIHSFPQVVYDGAEYVEYVYERVAANEFWIQCPTSAFHIKTVNTEVWTVDRAEEILSKCIWQLWFYSDGVWVEIEDVDSNFLVNQASKAITVVHNRLMTDGSRFDVTWRFGDIAKATVDFTAGASGNYSVMWHVEVPKADGYTKAEDRLIFRNASTFLAYLDYYDARLLLSGIEVSPLGETGRKASVTFANQQFESGEHIQIDPTVSTFYSEASRDGYIKKTGNAYPPVNTAVVTNERHGQCIVGQKYTSAAGGVYYRWRMFLSFNTSTATSNITSATLKVFLFSINSQPEWNLKVYSGFYGLALNANDWANCTTYEGVLFNTKGAVGGSWYNIGILTNSINTTGLTQFRLVSSRCESQTKPSTSEYATLLSGDAPTNDEKPVLTIYYGQAEEEEPGSGEGEPESQFPSGEELAEELGETIEEVREAVKIPAWGFWLIIGSLGTVAVASVLAKGGTKAAPRGVKPRKPSYTPHKRRPPQRRMPKRDKSGRFR